MIKLLKALTIGTADTSAAPRASVPAGHGLHSSFSQPTVPTTLQPNRRGRLKNGNRSGDFLAAPRCGARTRCGGACRQPAMKNGRCRMHGGLSTGPRTAEGLDRSRRARLTHGGYSAHVRQLRAAARAHGRRVRALVAVMRARRSAGHGVHRSEIRNQKSETRMAQAPAQSATSCRSALLSSGFSVLASGSSAGHGLHPSEIRSQKSEPGRAQPPARSSPSRRNALLASGFCVLASGISAGHGLHLSFFDNRPALR